MSNNFTEINVSNCSQSIFPNIANTTKYYTSLHIHLVLVICPLGLVTNFLTAITLNQSTMKSPTNLLLTFLAMSDGLIMALYIVFDVKFLQTGFLQSSPLKWAQYLFFSLVVQNIFHLFSSYLIVALAVFRLIYIRHPYRANVLCTMKTARYSILIIFISSLVLSIPYISAHKVTESSSYEINQNASYDVFFTVDYVSKKMGKFIHIWSSIFVKTLPIILMTGLSLWLIYELKNSERRRKVLKPDNQQKTLNKIAKPFHNQTRHESNDRTMKTTRILLSIIFIFLLSYLPQATLLLLTGILGECFSSNVYDQLGDIMDLLTLVNACIYFVLYCSMSKKFRDTFIDLFVSVPLNMVCFKRSRISEEYNSSKGFSGIKICKTEDHYKYTPCTTVHYQV